VVTDTLTRTNYITATGGTVYTITTRVITYTYDKLYRLTDADYSSGESFTYGYDPVGNRTVQTRTLTSTTVITYAYDAANRLTSVTSGTLTTTFEYDGLPAPVAQAQVGNRTAQAVGGVTTEYVLDVGGGLPEVIVTTTGGASTRYVQVQGQILGQQESGAWVYILPDHLGSVRQLVDAAGQVSLAQTVDGVETRYGLDEECIKPGSPREPAESHRLRLPGTRASEYVVPHPNVLDRTLVVRARRCTPTKRRMRCATVRSEIRWSQRPPLPTGQCLIRRWRLLEPWSQTASRPGHGWENAHGYELRIPWSQPVHWVSDEVKNALSQVPFRGQIGLTMCHKTIGIVNNGVGLVFVHLSQHLVIGNVSQFQGFTIGATVVDRKGARFNKMLAKGSQNTRVFAPSEIKCQEQRRGSIEENIVRPVDGNAVEAAVEIELRASQCISGAVKIDENCLPVDQC
jgi:YD repeat-containing protein